MNTKPFITIFTPTYNRGYVINKLYDSLLKQTIKDFEWIVIDDGSKDNTKELMEEIKNEGLIQLNYINKENEGKYKAINEALELAQGELFMIVDSDDYLTDDAIFQIREYYQQIRGKENFIGVVGLRGNNNMEIYTGYYYENLEKNKYYNLEYIDADYIDYRYKYKISGDRAEVCITEKLKKYKFPEITDEKFMSEGYLWNRLANDGYKFRYFNKIIYITEYLEDGLSKNMKEIKKMNPKNSMLEFNENISIRKLPFKVKIKSCVNYYRYSKLAKISLSEAFKNCNSKIMSIIAIPMALCYKIK